MLTECSQFINLDLNIVPETDKVSEGATLRSNILGLDDIEFTPEIPDLNFIVTRMETEVHKINMSNPAATSGNIITHDVAAKVMH